MSPEFRVKKKDVIDIVTKNKTGFPWGNFPNEKYTYILFWEDNRIKMTVNEFYPLNDHTYCCCRCYTGIVADSMEEYQKLSEEKLSAVAYNAWCTGAR